jgi:RNA polymerase sigma-70 factor (ECF subfamily)
MVFTLIMRITRNRESSEELLVDVYHDVWQRAPKYDPSGGTVVGWIMNQARSRALDRRRFEQRRKRASDRSEIVPAELLDARGDPREEVASIEQARALRRSLELLTSEERSAIEVAYFSGFTYAEAADRLQRPLGTIKTRIRSGLEKLRRALGAKEPVR